MGQLCCRAAPPEAVKDGDALDVARISAHDAYGLPKHSTFTDAVEVYEMGTSMVTVVANPAVDFSPRHSVSSESYYSVASHLAEDDVVSEGTLSPAGSGLSGAQASTTESPLQSMDGPESWAMAAARLQSVVIETLEAAFVAGASVVSTAPPATVLDRETALEQLATSMAAHRPLAAAAAARALGAEAVRAAGFDPRAILADEEAVHAALRAAGDADFTGWHVTRHKNVLQLMYRHVPHSTRHQVKVQVTVPYVPPELMAIMYEWDLMSTWNKYCMEPTILQRVSPYEADVYVGQWMPFPFSDLNVILRARGVDLADEDDSVLVFFSSSPISRTAPQLPSAAAKRSEVDVLEGCFIRLKTLDALPDGKPQTQCDIFVDIDPHIHFVPSLLVNFLLRVLCPYLYNTILGVRLEVLETQFGGNGQEGPFERRMRQSPALYDVIRQRLREVEERKKDGIR